MPTNLAILFPDPKVILDIEPEDLGGILLEIWKDVIQNGRCNADDFARPFSEPTYLRQHGQFIHTQILRATAEAMSWLEREGLILQDPTQPHGRWFVLSRRGAKIKNRSDLYAYRQASLLPRSLLHPKIDEKVWALFIRGDYDVAVHQAFKTVEVTVRDAAKLPADLVGVKLMRAAFDSQSGPLRDKYAVSSEREALAHLFAGAIGHAKNPHSHTDKTVGIEEAARLLLFASHLLHTAEIREILA